MKYKPENNELHKIDEKKALKLIADLRIGEKAIEKDTAAFNTFGFCLN